MAVNRRSGARGVARALENHEARLVELRDRRGREHEALLHAALRVLLARGYAQTRVEDVLREAGISTRAFYRFHAGKDQLFLELFARANEAAMSRLAATMAKHPKCADKLDAYVEATLDLAYAPRYRAETRLFASVPSEIAERYGDELNGCRKLLVGVLEEILVEGHESGELSTTRPEDDAWAIHGVLAEALRRVLAAEKPPPRARLSESLCRFVRAAVGAPASKAR